MSSAEIIFAAMSIAAPILSVIVAIIVARRNKDKDVKHDAEEWGVMKSDLRYIKEGVDDLKKSQSVHDTKLDTLGERVSKLEVAVDNHIKDKNIHNYVLAALASNSKSIKKGVKK